jgi:hypothetical protein
MSRLTRSRRKDELESTNDYAEGLRKDTMIPQSQERHTEDFCEADSGAMSVSVSAVTSHDKVDYYAGRQQGQFQPHNNKGTRTRLCRSCTMENLKYRMHEQCKIVRRYPQTAMLAFFLFLILLAASVTLCASVYNAERKALEAEAMTLAEETGLFFSDHFNQALLPLFSLAQFVGEIEVFRELEYEIGYVGESDALPFISETHRNVTGVCDDPTLVARFSKIAATVKSNSDMDGVLVNLQLAPDAVTCLVYPLNNTEDFPDGVFMDSTAVVGLDLLADPARKVVAEATLASDDVVVIGPVSLRQCDGCHPTVERAFIARLPVHSFMTDEERKERIGNQTSTTAGRYKKWGFVVALINWNALIEKSGIYETFEDGLLEFRMTQADPNAKDGEQVSHTFSTLL